MMAFGPNTHCFELMQGAVGNTELFSHLAGIYPMRAIHEEGNKGQVIRCCVIPCITKPFPQRIEHIALIFTLVIALVRRGRVTHKQQLGVGVHRHIFQPAVVRITEAVRPQPEPQTVVTLAQAIPCRTVFRVPWCHMARTQASATDHQPGGLPS